MERKTRIVGIAILSMFALAGCSSTANKCDEGYRGNDCKECDTGYQDNDTNGTCQPKCVTAELTCSDNAGCVDTSGTSICACNVGYHDEEGVCIKDVQCEANTCNNHGTCNDTTGVPVCTCASGYEGDCGQCAAGFQDANADGDCRPDCSDVVCTGTHEICLIDVGTGIAGCSCAPGYHDEGGTCVEDDLSIPTGRPRLFYTDATKLAAGRTWYANHGTSPDYDADVCSNPFGPDEDIVHLALDSLLDQNTQGCAKAIEWLQCYDPSGESTGQRRDHARWYGLNVILVYDWCHEQMSDIELAAVRDQWNAEFAWANEQAWGNPEMPGNNYYWGYLRNSLCWGIATFQENPQAQAFLDDAIDTRFYGTFVPATTGEFLGGVPPEGTQYGSYLIGYPVVPFVSARAYGVDLYRASNFYRELVFFAIYNTTPGPTVVEDLPASYHFYPFGDDERYLSPAGTGAYMIYGGAALGNQMITLSEVFGDELVGAYARGWLDRVEPNASLYVRSVEEPGISEAIDGLPLDYYAAGPGFWYAKNGWDEQATALQVQLGSVTGSHTHQDAGNFQLWHQGRWLTRETVSYGELITGFAGGDTISASKPVGHNSLLVQYRGVSPINPEYDSPDAPPAVTRLESRDHYAYAAVDMSSAFRAHAADRMANGQPIYDNAYVESVVREFLFIRPLSTLVIFDRIEATGFDRDDLIDQTDNVVTDPNLVTKTFLVHFEATAQHQLTAAATKPSGEERCGDWSMPQHHAVTVGDQVLRVSTLLPIDATHQLVDEANSAVGQQRLEVNTDGTPLSYFLHVLQGASAGEAALGLTVSTDGGSITLDLCHPSNGFARVVFIEGAASAGGGFAFSTAALPTATEDLRTTVQSLVVTGDGPSWGP